jgi:very-short-patch-repair endonuclease
MARLADVQHGRVAFWQLEPMGFTHRMIATRVRHGRLRRRFRGVYAAGHTVLTSRGRWMEAVLACGPRAVLSHAAAIALHGLRPVRGGPVDVTVPRRRQGQRGIRVHNVRRLDRRDIERIDNIPVTTLARALLDYAESARPRELGHALDAAERQGKLDWLEIDAMLARNPGRRGIKPLRAALAKMKGPAPWTQSENERFLLGLIRETDLSVPSTNVIVEGELVDFAWLEHRVVLEVDSYDFHKSRAKFNENRRRDAKLTLAGWTVLRIDEDRLRDDPDGVIRDVRALLVANAWRTAA